MAVAAQSVPSLRPVGVEDQAVVLGAVASNPEAMDAFASVIAGTLSPTEFFDPAHIDRILRAA